MHSSEPGIRLSIGSGGILCQSRHPARGRPPPSWPPLCRIALNVIKLGMNTKQVIARSTGNGRRLAMMDHPSIAKVLDAGATDTGRPYFVMELVRGLPITSYCDEHRLTIR
jgi:eukaryotic-like serine/threonine-protein kinase